MERDLCCVSGTDWCGLDWVCEHAPPHRRRYYLPLDQWPTAASLVTFRRTTYTLDELRHILFIGYLVDTGRMGGQWDGGQRR